MPKVAKSFTLLQIDYILYRIFYLNFIPLNFNYLIIIFHLAIDSSKDI